MTGNESATGEDPSILVFDPEKRRMPLHLPKRDFLKLDECRHLNVALDEQSRTVICDQCSKALDPFFYLILLAKEWEHRAYRDDAAKKAFEAIRQRELDAMARGRIFQKPSDGAALRAWEVFARYLGREPFSIYRQGNSWYLVEDDGSRMSEDYVLMLLRRAEFANTDSGSASQ